MEPCPAFQIAADSMFMSVAQTTNPSPSGGAGRRTPLGVKLTEGGFSSFHAAHAAGSKALEELVENILNKDENTAGAGQHPPRRKTSHRSTRSFHTSPPSKRPSKLPQGGFRCFEPHMFR